MNSKTAAKKKLDAVAFRQSAGSWKGRLDADKLIKRIYTARTKSSSARRNPGTKRAV